MTSFKGRENGDSGPIAPEVAPMFGAGEKLDPDGALARALGRAPGEDELILWAGMSTDRREKALQRIAVLRRWTEESGELTAAEAAEEMDAAVSRFYQIAAKWKSSPTLNVVS